MGFQVSLTCEVMENSVLIPKYQQDVILIVKRYLSILRAPKGFSVPSFHETSYFLPLLLPPPPLLLLLLYFLPLFLLLFLSSYFSFPSSPHILLFLPFPLPPLLLLFFQQDILLFSRSEHDKGHINFGKAFKDYQGNKLSTSQKRQPKKEHYHTTFKKIPSNKSPNNMLLTKTAKQNHHQQNIIQNPLNGI